MATEGWMDLLGRVARQMRRAPERWLHPMRRRAACRRLSSGTRAPKVLVVCMGNICRSPLAERYLEDITAGWAHPPAKVTSAGFLQAEREAPHEAVVAARELGVDLRDHRSSTVSPQAIEHADVVLVMKARQKRAIEALCPQGRRRVLVLGDFDPASRIELRTIRDPFGGDLETFRRCYRRIARCLDVVAAHLPGAGAGPRTATRSTAAGPAGSRA